MTIRPDPSSHEHAAGILAKRSLTPTAWVILAVTVLAIVLRWWVVRTAWVDRPIRGDALDYVSYAINLVEHHTFSRAANGAPVVPDSYRDPGYPLFLAPFIALVHNAGARLALLQLTQALLGGLAVTHTLLVGRHWLKPAWLAVAGTLMAVWPHTLVAPLYVLSEPLTAYLLTLGLWLATECLMRQSERTGIAAGLAFGLAGLTNAVLAPFLPVFAAVGMLRRPRHRRLFALMLAASLLLPAAWMVRNLTASHGDTPTTRAMTNFVQGSHPDYHSAWRDAAEEPEARRVTDAIAREADAAGRDPLAGTSLVFHRLAGAPVDYLSWYISKPALLWSWEMQIASGHVYPFPTYDSPLQDNDAMWYMTQGLIALNPWFSALALLGVLRALCTGRPAGSRMAAAILAYVTLVYAVLQAEPRYATTFRPIELLMVVTALAWLLSLAARAAHKVTNRVTM